MQKSGQAAYLEAIAGLCPPLRFRLQKRDASCAERTFEIRLMADVPPLLNIAGKMERWGSPVTKQELEESLIFLCQRSVHTHQWELSQGFLSLPGGHRAGIAGHAIYGADGTVQSVRNVTAIVIRISREIPGIALALIQRIFSHGVCGTLLVGAPGSGKTTLLCDMAKSLASGAVSGIAAVAIVDERGELSRAALGCCLLEGYEKADGILTAVRSLSPQVIFCDEIGSRRDVEAVQWALNSGVSVVATIHARDKEELLRRQAGRMLLLSGAFEKVVFLGTVPVPSTVREVCNGYELESFLRHSADGSQLCRNWNFDRKAAASTSH